MPGEVFFCFLVRHLEWVCRKLLSLVKLYQKVWIWNINQNFCKISKNTFFYRTPPVAASPNRGYLHCAILKAWQDFQEKRALKSRDMQFFLQNIPVEIFKIFKMFENNIKFTRAACWINSKITNRGKNTTLIIFCHYCWLLLWCNYWKSLKSESHHQKTLLYLLQWKRFNDDEKCTLYFILKNVLVLKIFKVLCWLFGHVKKRLD